MGDLIIQPMLLLFVQTATDVFNRDGEAYNSSLIAKMTIIELQTPEA